MLRNFFKRQMEEQPDNWEDNYPGNIWGWKFSLIGLFVLLFLLGLMIYRHYSLGVPFGGEKNEKVEKVENVQ